MKRAKGERVQGDKFAFYKKGEDGRTNDFISINDMSLLTGASYEDEGEETPDFKRAVAWGKVARDLNTALTAGKTPEVTLANHRKGNDFLTDDGKTIEGGMELMIREFEIPKANAGGKGKKKSAENTQQAAIG